MVVPNLENYSEMRGRSVYSEEAEAQRQREEANNEAYRKKNEEDINSMFHAGSGSTTGESNFIKREEAKATQIIEKVQEKAENGTLTEKEAWDAHDALKNIKTDVQIHRIQHGQHP